VHRRQHGPGRVVLSRIRFAPAWLTAATIAVVAALFGLAPSLLEAIELNWLDLRFRVRGPLEPGPAVVIAAIDEKSLESEGRWPWRRSRLAALVDALSRDGASVIAFDVLFAEPEAGDNDRLLLGALERSRAPVVLGYFFHMTDKSLGYALGPEDIARRLEPIGRSKYPLVLKAQDALAFPVNKAYAPQANLDFLSNAAASTGYFSVTSDRDGVVRWMPLMLEAGEDLFPPLSVLCVWHYLGRPVLGVRADRYGVSGVQIGKRFVPTDETGQLLINYRGPAHTFPTYSISDILAGRLPAGTFRDKIVIVGATAIGIGDIRTAPFGPLYPGPEVHANVVDNILAGDFLERPRWSRAFDLLAIVALALLTALALRRTAALAGLQIAGLLFVSYVGIAYALFARAGLWLNMVYPLLALAATYTLLTVHRYVLEERERRWIKGAFQHYVSPDVIELMMKDRAGVQLGGKEQLVSMLISDMEGFTNFSERHSPSEVIGVIGDYYADMTEQVFAQQGTLVEYVGDELFALFGAPVEQRDHARRACATALAMRERRTALGDAWEKVGRPRIRARTGINSGTVLVGNIGSKYRFHYGAMGDAVNLTSRLESLNKIYRTDIILSDDTARLCEGAFRTRELDLVRVKGRAQAIVIHELVGTADAPLPLPQQELLRLYPLGLAAYRRQQWAAAIEHFTGCVAWVAGDGPSQLMLMRCRLYRDRPPPRDWDGAFEDRQGKSASPEASLTDLSSG